MSARDFCASAELVVAEGTTPLAVDKHAAIERFREIHLPQILVGNRQIELNERIVRVLGMHGCEHVACFGVVAGVQGLKPFVHDAFNPPRQQRRHILPLSERQRHKRNKAKANPW